MQNIIIMAKREDPFARVSKSMLDDERLSWRAKGLLSYLLGKPAGWKVQRADLEKKSKDGGRSVRSGLKELRRFGYAELSSVRSGGRIREWTWKISDTPIFSPDERNAHVETAHSSKKECTKKETAAEASETKETSSGEDVGSLKKEEGSDSTWKPDSRTKEQKLKTIRSPKDYPSERDFESFITDQFLDHLSTYRPELYFDLCRNKWHTWKAGINKWVPIVDWRKYVAGLNEHMEAQF